MTALSEIESLLKRTMGLDAASIGSSAIETAVRHRIAACQQPTLGAYRDFVQSSEQELQELIEAIVVPETWFFRDREALAALTRAALEPSAKKRAQGALRLLSLPCSTGEEPYSIAMALLDAGIAPDRFHVDAVDISQRALVLAQAGIYGRNAFRGADLAFRQRYFETTDAGWRIGEAPRQRVQFRRGNVLDADFVSRLGVYDAIFCRNVLIYFDTATQQRALAALAALLAPDGLLFVAPAESGLLLGYDFRPVQEAAACVFRKGRDTKSAPPKPLARRDASRPIPPRAAAPAFSAPPSKKPEPSAPASERTLDEIVHLADQGRLADADRQVREYLDKHGPSAAAFHALGLVCGASDRALDAAMYYRKVLYLEPNHHDALVHLALTLEQLGDAAGARLFRDRALRIQAREKRP